MNSLEVTSLSSSAAKLRKDYYEGSLLTILKYDYGNVICYQYLQAQNQINQKLWFPRKSFQLSGLKLVYNNKIQLLRLLFIWLKILNIRLVPYFGGRFCPIYVQEKYELLATTIITLFDETS